MTKKLLFNIYTYFIFINISFNIVYAEDSSKEILDEFKRNITFFTSYSADFNQILEDQENFQVSKSRGNIWLKRPNLFRWQTKIPDEILIISDGNKIWNYDADLAQVVQHPLQE